MGALRFRSALGCRKMPWLDNCKAAQQISNSVGRHAVLALIVCLRCRPSHRTPERRPISDVGSISVGESHCKIVVAKGLNVEILYKQDLVGPHECRSWALCLPRMQKHFLIESLFKSTCPPSSSPLEPLRSKRGPNKSSGSLMPRSTNFLEGGKAGKFWDLKICHELTSANRNPFGSSASMLVYSVMYSYNDSKLLRLRAAELFVCCVIFLTCAATRLHFWRPWMDMQGIGVASISGAHPAT